MALQDYTTIPVLYNGSRIEQITSIRLTGESGQQRVELLDVGLGGFSPGNGSTNAEIGFAIPRGGTEFEYWNHMAEGAFVDLQIGVGPQSLAARGKIMTVTINREQGSPSGGTFTWDGPLQRMEG